MSRHRTSCRDEGPFDGPDRGAQELVAMVEALQKAAAEGDQFDDAAWLHLTSVLQGAAARLARNKEDVRDAAQEVVHRLFRMFSLARSELAKMKYPGRYVLKMLRNEVRGRWRRENRRAAYEQDASKPEATFVPDEVVRKERAGQVLAMLDDLPRLKAELLKLCYVDGLTYAQAALVKNLKPTQVRDYLCATKEALRDRYKQRFFDWGESCDKQS